MSENNKKINITELLERKLVKLLADLSIEVAKEISKDKDFSIPVAYSIKRILKEHFDYENIILEILSRDKEVVDFAESLFETGNDDYIS